MHINDYHVLVQAREGSVRLPGKTLRSLLNHSLIASVILRFKRCKCTILTGAQENNQKLASHLLSLGYKVQFGSEKNVFLRFAEFARNSEVKNLVRITGDNPFVYHHCIEDMIELMNANNLDYCISENVPIGCALEVVKRESLLKLENRGIDEFTKEHVTPNFYSSNSSWKWQKYSCEFASIASLRLTVDTFEDLSLVMNICRFFGKEAEDISLFELEDLYIRNPDFFGVNQTVRQRSFRELE